MGRLLAILILSLWVCGTYAQTNWPQKTISLIVPFAPGGSTDITARLLAQKLKIQLGQNVVVDNKPGAGGNTGAQYVVNAPSDGYTLLMATSTLATNMSLFKNLTFDLQKDLVPISQIALIPNVLMVNNDLPANNIIEFIALAKQKELFYGSAGNGSSQHLSGALLNSMIGGKMTHVPYKGGAPANVDLLAGQIHLVVSPLVEVLSYIDSGKLKPLGVTTKSRTPRLANVPAIDEVLPGYEVVLWNGILAPAKTPGPIVSKLGIAIKKVMIDPEFQKILEEQGSKAVGSSPLEFKEFIANEVPKWARIVQISGAKVE
jgi:tripartite-type tricarboxylate transporter receptor subunit TctC